jgi:CRISPR-associated protein Csx16
VHRLVTFLGRGRYDKAVGRYRYDPAIYRFGDRTAEEAPYLCRALADLLQPAEIRVLATQESEADHRECLEETLRLANLPAPRFVRIPLGKNRDELWQQFQAIKSELRGAAGPVMLDITHGFRSSPVFAAAVTAFIRAVDAAAPELRLCYGAFEQKDRESGVTPVWELSEFVSLLDWSQALAMFLHTGRADEAAAETTKLGRVLRKIWADGGRDGPEPNLKGLGEALARFGRDFETVRTGDLLIGRQGVKSSAAGLAAAARRGEEEVRRHAPPLADVLDRVVAIAEPLAVEQADLSGEPGRKAVAALAKAYLRLGRYLEAAATVREGWVNFHASRTALSPGAPDFDKDARQAAEGRARVSEQRFKPVMDRRDDLLHAQYRQASATQDGAGISKTINRLVEDFVEASCTAQDQTAFGSNGERAAIFVNLSNHPKSQWTAEQTDAASAFGKGTGIEDLCFPAVPPDADEARVGKIAEECIAQIPAGATHALVQGEFTLTMELVGRLQARGIVCFAATSAREVEEAEGGRRMSVFKFVRFRRYPQLRPG